MSQEKGAVIEAGHLGLAGALCLGVPLDQLCEFSQKRDTLVQDLAADSPWMLNELVNKKQISLCKYIFLIFKFVLIHYP